MDNPLDSVELRILGSLIEKESTTPDNYPLTLNSVVLACNQTSNRDPVLALEEAHVSRGIASLTRRGLVREVFRSDSRAKRYRHQLAETMHLHPAEIAVLGVLMLRGAQTVGEIRTRTARLFEFRDLPHVDVTLQALMTMPTPLVVELPRRPGQKEARYAQLLGGAPAEEPHTQAAAPAPARTDRVDELEQVVATLRAEVTELRAQFEEFRKQFQ